MRLVKVATDTGLSGYNEARIQQSLQLEYLGHAHYAELQPASNRAGLPRPARIPPWFLSSLLNRRNARASLREILAADLATGVGRSMYVGVRVPTNEGSDRIGKGVNPLRRLGGQVGCGQGAGNRHGGALRTGLWGSSSYWCIRTCSYIRAQEEDDTSSNASITYMDMGLLNVGEPDIGQCKKDRLLVITDGQ
jgi:hypothetical protein